MKILVDADACPVKAEVQDVARRHGLEVVLVASLAHEIGEGGPGVVVVRVDKSPQATDIALINQTQSGDVVVSDDYGLACMALARGARVLSSRGRAVDEENIDGLLAFRHASARARRGGHRGRGPAPFTKADAARFRAALEQVCQQVSRD